MMTISLSDLISYDFTNLPLWGDGYKIPWDSPEFSKRMLGEHLSQDHDLASRKIEGMERQVQWIHDRFLSGRQCDVMDLGCGPGLYSPLFTKLGHRYIGMDFGPASVEYANQHFATPGHCEFRLGNVLADAYGGPHDFLMMVYGEFNVFPPRDSLRILASAFESLKPGGRMVLEAYSFDAVRALGSGNSWFTAPTSVFSDSPHLCLTTNEWLEEDSVARQHFLVVDPVDSEVGIMCSTTKAWTDDDYLRLFDEAGFTDIQFEEDWPHTSDGFVAISAHKPDW